MGQFWNAPRKLTPISKESIACLIVTDGGGSKDTADNACGKTDDEHGISDDSTTTISLSFSFVEHAVGNGNDGTGSEAN